MSVVKSRALPEVSDGQKPVQRRILVDMDRMGIRWDAKNVKSARVVGDVLGKYHPHGDQSVYDALVRMAQDFSMRYPLIAGEGNFGSRDGDSQAAMRYTETRLMPIAKLLLEELDQGAVDFVPNYDGNFSEPVELPAKLPFVLLNGSSGIAVGMATEIPSHNLKETAEACVLLLERPEATLDEVMEKLPHYDCGACGFASCRNMAENIALGLPGPVLARRALVPLRSTGAKACSAKENQAAGACPSRAVNLLSKRFLPFLPRHLHQPQRRHIHQRRFYGILFQLRAQVFHQLLPGLFRFHIDKISDDDAGEVAQAQLAGDLGGRLPVDFPEGVLLLFMSLEFPGVHIDDREGLCGLNHQIAAGFQPDPLPQGLIKGFGKPVDTAQGRGRLLIKHKLFPILRLVLLKVGAQLLIELSVICENPQEPVLGKASKPGRVRRRLPVYQGKTGLVLPGLNGSLAEGGQAGQLFLKLRSVRASRVCADDDAEILRKKGLCKLAQAEPFRLSKLCGNPKSLFPGGENQVFPGKIQVAGDGGSLGLDGLPAHLDKDLVSGSQLPALFGRGVERLFLICQRIIAEDAVRDFHKGRVNIGKDIFYLAHVNISQKRTGPGRAAGQLRRAAVLIKGAYNPFLPVQGKLCHKKGSLLFHF